MMTLRSVYTVVLPPRFSDPKRAVERWLADLGGHLALEAVAGDGVVVYSGTGWRWQNRFGGWTRSCFRVVSGVTFRVEARGATVTIQQEVRLRAAVVLSAAFSLGAFLMLAALGRSEAWLPLLFGIFALLAWYQVVTYAARNYIKQRLAAVFIDHVVNPDAATSSAQMPASRP